MRASSCSAAARADPGAEIRNAARARLAAAAADGSLRVVVAATHPLDAVADAPADHDRADHRQDRPAALTSAGQVADELAELREVAALDHR
jgi:hypothetical protein